MTNFYSYPVNDYRYYLQHNDADMKYGLPEKKKYPMPDRDHVISAIKFFNYVSTSDEKELARNILARIREYGITNISVGENNRFGKYYKQANYLAHHGILGQRWGVRRYQNADGTLTNAGKKRYAKSVAKELTELTKDCWSGTNEIWGHISDRGIKASDLGLRALYNMGRLNQVDGPDYNPNDHREWFLFEDQTIGMAMVADLVNQGYSEKRIGHLLNEADKNSTYAFNDSINRKTQDALFELSEGNWNGTLKTFARECINIKNEEKINDAKKNDKYEMDFLETVQNDVVLRKGGKDLINEYKKYLNDKEDYMSTFEESDYQKHYKNTPKVREAMRIAKSEGWDALTDAQKELLAF